MEKEIVKESVEKEIVAGTEAKATEKKSKKSSGGKNTKAPAIKKEKKSEASVTIIIQKDGKDYLLSDILSDVAARTSGASTLDIYIKPEDRKAYYVADGVSGEVDLVSQPTRRLNHRA